MKKIMMSMILLLLGIGIAQSQNTEKQTNNISQDGPKIEQVESENDFYGDIQKSAKKDKAKIKSMEQEKIALIEERERVNPEFKYHSAENSKPKKTLSSERIKDFGQGKEQVFSRIKHMKRIRRVEGMAPREEIKKIDGHSQISEDVLIQALGKSKPIEAK